MVHLVLLRAFVVGVGSGPDPGTPLLAGIRSGMLVFDRLSAEAWCIIAGEEGGWL